MLGVSQKLMLGVSQGLMLWVSQDLLSAQAVSRGSPLPDGMPAGAITLQPGHVSGTAQVTMSIFTSKVQLLLGRNTPKQATVAIV